jgi:drug/metabolite transporter (DMT)-like permease
VEKFSNTNSLKPDFFKTAAALVAANFFFGTNVIAVKKISPLFISPISLGYLRMIFATAVFFILSYILGKNERIKKEDLPTILLAAVTGISLNQIQWNSQYQPGSRIVAEHGNTHFCFHPCDCFFKRSFWME